MKLRKKKGFTIIELVIVIAVIGILTAVLVPTFINLTAKANEAADDSLVKNLNTALKMEEQTPGKKKNETLQDAVDDLEEEGYILENIISKSGQDLLWDQPKNEFVLNKENKYQGKDYWQIVKEVPAYANQKYSYYAGKNFNTEVPELKYGFDAGKNDDIEELVFKGDGSSSQVVSIRTNGGTLQVGTNATEVAEGKIVHFGTLDNAIIYTTSNSFHTHGKIANMELYAGKAVAENSGYVALVKAVENSTYPVSVEEKDSGIFYIPADTVASNVDSTVATSLGYTTENDVLVIDETTEAGAKRESTLVSTAYEIANKFDLVAFRDSWNDGKFNNGMKVALTNDIDMGGYYWVTPIGTKTKPFLGSFDGQNFKINDLSNAGHKTTETFTNATSGTQGEIFGLFGYVTGDTTIANFEISVNAQYASGKSWAAVVAASAQNKANEVTNLVLENITVRGELSGNDKCAGFVGQAAPYGSTAGTLKILNCKNYANVTASSKRAAGFVGGIGATSATKISDVEFTNCHNYGTITAPTMVGAIVGNLNQATQGNAQNIYQNSVSSNQTWIDVANSSATYKYSNCTSTATVSSGRLFNDEIDYGYDNDGQIISKYAKIHASYFNNVNIDGSAVANWEVNDKFRYLAGLAYEETRTVIATLNYSGITRTYVEGLTYGAKQGFNAVLSDHYLSNGSTMVLHQDLLLTTHDGDSDYYSFWKNGGSPTIDFNGHSVDENSVLICIRTSSASITNLVNGKVMVYKTVAPTINGIQIEASSDTVTYEFENGVLK